MANLQGKLQQHLYLAHILPASILLTSCGVIQDLWFQPFFCPGPRVSYLCPPLGTFLVPFLLEYKPPLCQVTSFWEGKDLTRDHAASDWGAHPQLALYHVYLYAP